MADLSPAVVAGELLLAYCRGTVWRTHPDPFGFAASLEALADQIHAGYPLSDTVEDCIRGAEREHIRAGLYTLAAELRGGAK